MTAEAPAGPRPTSASADGVAGLAGRLRIVAGRITRADSAQTVVDGMTPSRVAVLTTLHRHGPLRMGELAEQLGISAPTASRLVECLAERRLVERVPDMDDHRATRVRLCAAGAAGLTTLRERGAGLLANRLAGCSASELAALDAAMDVLEKIVVGP